MTKAEYLGKGEDSLGVVNDTSYALDTRVKYAQLATANLLMAQLLSRAQRDVHT